MGNSRVRDFVLRVDVADPHAPENDITSLLRDAEELRKDLRLAGVSFRLGPVTYTATALGVIEYTVNTGIRLRKLDEYSRVK